ncbi:MAG: FixH family protein [Gammaproteobacteria bacterium]|nr:FixH family protein [Gammaproteobacteria bacterium]
MTQQGPENTPWYRQKWPYLVMLPPFAAVVAGIATVMIANSGSDSLVVDNFQKVGLVANRVTEADRSATELGISASVAVDHESGNITVRLEAKDLPDTLSISLHHPTRSDMDRSTTLSRDATGLYRGNIGSLDTHRWYLQLVAGDGSWRLTDTLAADQRLLSFAPAGNNEEK